MNIKNSWYILLVLPIIAVSCKPNPYAQGERIYNVYCINCHMEDGSGFRMLYPPLNDSDYLRNNFEELPCIIRYGMNDTIHVNGQEFNLPMLGIKELNAVEITNLVNYINYRWDYAEDQISLDDIEKKLQECN